MMQWAENEFRQIFYVCNVWAIPQVQLGLSRRNSGKFPERPRKCSQSVSWNSPWEYSWDFPNPLIQGIWGFQSISRILSPWVRLGTPLFVQWFRRGPPRADHGISSRFLDVFERWGTDTQPRTDSPKVVNKQNYDYDLSRHLQESPGPPGPESQKSLKKGLFGGLQKSP